MPTFPRVVSARRHRHPEAVLTKVPSAELRANQTDQDSLPPYAELDDILVCLVEKEMPLGEIVARGHAAETVKRIERMLYLAEYKRRQAPPGVKISSKNFGRDRRYPIVNKFREEVAPAKPAAGVRAPAPTVKSWAIVSPATRASARVPCT